MPVVRTNVVETPRYFPEVSTANQVTTPRRAPAAYGDQWAFHRKFILPPLYKWDGFFYYAMKRNPEKRISFSALETTGRIKMCKSCIAGARFAQI